VTTVQFTQDYRGHLTNENYYTAGTVAFFAEGAAAALVEAGRAVVVLPPQTPPEAETTTPVQSVAGVEKARVTSVTSGQGDSEPKPVAKRKRTAKAKG
jgi:hypothetical protein